MASAHRLFVSRGYNGHVGLTNVYYSGSPIIPTPSPLVNLVCFPHTKFPLFSILVQYGKFSLYSPKKIRLQCSVLRVYNASPRIYTVRGPLFSSLLAADRGAFSLLVSAPYLVQCSNQNTLSQTSCLLGRLVDCEWTSTVNCPSLIFVFHNLFQIRDKNHIQPLMLNSLFIIKPVMQRSAFVVQELLNRLHIMLSAHSTCCTLLNGIKPGCIPFNKLNGKRKH